MAESHQDVSFEILKHVLEPLTDDLEQQLIGHQVFTQGETGSSSRSLFRFYYLYKSYPILYPKMRATLQKIVMGLVSILSTVGQAKLCLVEKLELRIVLTPESLEMAKRKLHQSLVSFYPILGGGLLNDMLLWLLQKGFLKVCSGIQSETKSFQYRYYTVSRGFVKDVLRRLFAGCGTQYETMDQLPESVLERICSQLTRELEKEYRIPEYDEEFIFDYIEDITTKPSPVRSSVVYVVLKKKLVFQQGETMPWSDFVTLVAKYLQEDLSLRIPKGQPYKFKSLPRELLNELDFALESWRIQSQAEKASKYGYDFATHLVEQYVDYLKHMQCIEVDERGCDRLQWVVGNRSGMPVKIVGRAKLIEGELLEVIGKWIKDDAKWPWEFKGRTWDQLLEGWEGCGLNT